MLLPDGEALGLGDLLEALWKTISQVLAVGRGYFLPDLPYCNLKLGDCRRILLTKAALQDPPKVFSGRQIRSLARPIMDEVDFVVREPLFACP